MSISLPEYLAQHEELRQSLLAQEGGILKFLAEHLDAKDTDSLFHAYQDQCVEEFYESNKWNLTKVWTGNDMRIAALGVTSHIWNELRYQSDAAPLLDKLPEKEAEMLHWFYDLYLEYAYVQNRNLWHPAEFTPREVYREVVDLYAVGGLAYKCIEIILKDYHTNGTASKTESDRLDEFMIRQFVSHLRLGINIQLRQAVAEMLDGKKDELCRQMAIDTMERVRNFSQTIYTDGVVESLRSINFTIEAEQREKNGQILRDIVRKSFNKIPSRRGHTSSMGFCLANFVYLLKDVGRIWAAQLLVRGIDMHDLEKEVNCIMKPADEPFYYVDYFFFNDLPDQYCIKDSTRAEKLLKVMGHKFIQSSYLEAADMKNEVGCKTLLSKAYNVLKKEVFLDGDATSQVTFVDALTRETDKKIVWTNDPGQKFLRTLIKTFLGISKKYSYPPILKVSKKGSYAAFIKLHFVDEKNEPIDFKTNGHDIGKKDKKRFEGILLAIYSAIVRKRRT